MVEAQKIGEVKNLGLIYQVIGSLDKQILAFEKKGIKYPYLVTPEEACMIRLAGVSNDWTRTCVVPVAVKDENPILYKISPFMNPAMAKVIVNSHRIGEYSLLGREVYECISEIAKEELGLEPEDRTAHILQSKEEYDLTPKMEDTRFILGKPTNEYFERFMHKLIKFSNLPSSDLPKDKCVVNYLWFFSPENGSSLGCRSTSSDGDAPAFGVLRKTSGAGSQKNLYSLSEVKIAIKKSVPELCSNQKITGVEKILTPIEKIILNNLRTQ